MIIHSASFQIGAASWKDLPEGDLPEAGFAGRSNVGKSSLINLLLRRKNLARTSGQPGKTQQLNYYLINEAFFLVDLPGFGYARVSKRQREQWVKLIERYLNERSQLRVLVHLIDSRHEPTDLDLHVVDFVRTAGIPYLIALTKADKLSGNERARAVDVVRRSVADHGLEPPVILTSAAKERGKEELWEWLEMYLT